MGLLSQNQATYYGSGNSANYGDYQFTSLADIINGFMVAYVGESKLISKVSRTDVQFHGMRAIQEFSYDIFRSVKSQEIEVPNTLKMILPQDYVNYVKLTTSGNDGVKRNLYPTGKTSNPFAITQDGSGDYVFGGNAEGDYRKLSITCPASGLLSDGDHIVISYKKYDGTSGNVYFIVNTDNNYKDGTAPAGSDNNPKFFITWGSAITAETVATKLAGAINDFGKFSATTNGAVVNITYKDVNSSYSQASLSSTASDNSSHWPISVTYAGVTTASSPNLTEQTESDTWSNYKSLVPIDLRGDDYETDNFVVNNVGGRYGLDPQHAHDSGSFYIDYNKGFIHFGSALAGKTIVLDYISDGLGTDEEMVVHKFAEEAVYKWIAYGIISSRSNMPEYIVQRFKKERFAEARKAKIRLSNIKIEEFTQVLKGLSKPIK